MPKVNIGRIYKGFSLKEQLCIVNKQLYAAIAMLYTDLLQILIIKGSKYIICELLKASNNSNNIDKEVEDIIDEEDEIAINTFNDGIIYHPNLKKELNIKNKNKFINENDLIKKLEQSTDTDITIDNNVNSYITNILATNLKIGEFIITTVLILAVYYLCQSLDIYEVDKNEINKKFVLANYLNLFSSMVRYDAIVCSTPAEDIDEELDEESELDQI